MKTAIRTGISKTCLLLTVFIIFILASVTVSAALGCGTISCEPGAQAGGDGEGDPSTQTGQSPLGDDDKESPSDTGSGGPTDDSKDDSLGDSDSGDGSSSDSSSDSSDGSDTSEGNPDAEANAEMIEGLPGPEDILPDEETFGLSDQLGDSVLGSSPHDHLGLDLEGGLSLAGSPEESGKTSEKPATSLTTDGQYEAPVGPDGFHQVGSEPYWDYVNSQLTESGAWGSKGKPNKDGSVTYKGADGKQSITVNPDGTFEKEGLNGETYNGKIYGDGSVVFVGEDGNAIYQDALSGATQQVGGHIDPDTGDALFTFGPEGSPTNMVRFSPDDNKVVNSNLVDHTETRTFNDGSKVDVNLNTGEATYTSADGTETYSGTLVTDAETGQQTITDSKGKEVILNEHGAVLLNEQEEVSLSDLAQRAGSWDKIFKPGAFANALTTMGAKWWNGESGWLQDTWLARAGNYLDYDDWAEDICAGRRLQDNNKGFFTSPNGDVVHFEAEKTAVDPCGGMEGLVEQSEDLDAGGCQEYAVYKISGMIMAKSVPMGVVVELNRPSEGKMHNLYGAGTVLEIAPNQIFSLIGANMHVFQSRWDFDQICWHFNNWKDISRSLGGAAWNFEGKICQDIAVAKEPWYRNAEDQLAGGGAGGYTPQDFGGAGDEFGEDDFGDATGNDQSGGYAPQNLGQDAEDSDWDF